MTQTTEKTAEKVYSYLRFSSAQQMQGDRPNPPPYRKGGIVGDRLTLPPKEHNMKWYTKNKYFETDTGKGFAHKPSSVCGSVTKKPLIKKNNEGNSLWFEFAKPVNGKSNEQLYWLVWYKNENGKPLTIASAVFNGKDFGNLFIRLLDSIPTKPPT